MDQESTPDAPMDDLSVRLRAELKRHFGYADFRPGQEAVVRAVLDLSLIHI